jgi:hypothetical protein
MRKGVRVTEVKQERTKSGNYRECKKGKKTDKRNSIKVTERNKGKKRAKKKF